MQIAPPSRSRPRVGKGIVSLLWVLAAVAASTARAAPAALTAELINPRGDARGARQAVVRYSEAMIRFGDPRAPAPVTVDCAVKGSGHWLDERNWAYDFDTPLPAGLHCQLTGVPTTVALSGAKLMVPARFAIETGPPGVAASLPESGAQSIDEKQVFALSVDAPVDLASVTDRARCEVEGINEAIGVRVLTGTEREKYLKAIETQTWRYRRLLNPESPWAVPEPGARDRIVVLTCARTLPQGRPMRLMWNAGIRSLSGVARTQDQALTFMVRRAFVAQYHCVRLTEKGACTPVGNIDLSFSAPVRGADAARVRLVASSGMTYAPAASVATTPFVESVQFKAPFAPREKLRIELPAGLRDDVGRTLANADQFPATIPLDDAPPLAKFAADFGILELNADPALPVTLRHVENPLTGAVRSLPSVAGQALAITDDLAIMDWLGRLERHQEREDDSATPLLTAADHAVPLSVPWPDSGATEVVGIPLRTPGLHVVELQSPRLATALGYGAKPFYVRAAALVTNLDVHLKIGRENSLVWVTRLDNAKTVAGAHIVMRDCTGAIRWQGTTDKDGIARAALESAGTRAPGTSTCRLQGQYFVSARLGTDIAFASTNWKRGISPWDFGVNARSPEDSWRDPELIIAHTVYDRTLLRAGETVHMKHIVRRQVGTGFALPAADEIPDQVRIRHDGTELSWDVAVKLGADGVATTDWEIPRTAALGSYSVALRRGGRTVSQSEFAVEEFRLPTMRAVLQLPKGPLVAPANVDADALVTYLAGGGAAGAPATVRWRLEASSNTPEDYPDFSFLQGAVKTGLDTSAYGSDDEDGEPGPDAARSTAVVHEQPTPLDSAGSARVRLDQLGSIVEPAELVAELEYPDANGQRLSVATRAPVWPAAVRVGVRADRWPRVGEPFSVDALALDVEGKPLARQAVTIEAYRRTIYSYRKRLLGGFYSYQNRTETTKLADLCRGETDTLGRLHCSATYSDGDSIVLRVVAKDAKARVAAASQQVWLMGADAWWGGADHDRMDLIPASRHYEVGQTAELEARVPFHSSTALVTVEREGILDAFVTSVSAKSPRIAVPIRRGYSPNLFVSVLAVRGRVDAPQPTAMVDLGRPTFRLGLVELKVGHAPHRLDVRVTSDKEVYPTRTTAKVRIRATRPDGKPAAHADVAFAAVDEALLELRPNRSWNLLQAMMTQRPLEVDTATAALQVIGKRHYGRKALAPGGGGGAQPARELFDTLLLWKPRVALDAKGEAELSVPLNDSLSSFRMTAIATDAVDYFGTGGASVRTHRDLMLFAGVPEVVREGDAERATVTIRNASNRPLSVRVTADATADRGRVPPLVPQSTTLPAGEARELSWPVDVPQGAERITWTFAGTADGVAGDSLKVPQKVMAWPGPPKIYQSTLMRIDQPATLEIERPADALPNSGGLVVAWSRTLTGSLEGVKKYMTEYPYDCLEQRVSRAVTLGDKALWAGIVRDLPRYVDGHGLLRFFPASQLEGSDVLTAYVLSITAEAGLELPEATRDTLLASLGEYVDGRRQYRGLFRPGDELLRRLVALDALAHYGQVSDARVTAFKADPTYWPTSALLDWISVLRRTTAGSDPRLAEASALLRNRLRYSGTRVMFSTEESDIEWWLMRTPDQNAVRAVLLFKEDPAWRADVPRLMTGAIARQVHGHWDTTLSNAWGSVAVRAFAARFESTPLTGSANASLAETSRVTEWAKHPDGETVSLPWPESGRGTATLKQDGTGAPWATVSASAAIPLDKPFAAGIKVTRKFIPVREAHPGRHTRGDLVRVVIEFETGSDLTWVAVNDPIPAGSSIVGVFARNGVPLGLDTPSDEAWPVYAEAGFTGLRAYIDWLPRGHARLDYLVRLNTSGRFKMPATRVEAMYAPDIFGATPNAPVEIDPAP
jgi:hypothetical protein